MPETIRSFSGPYSALSLTFKSGFFYENDEYHSAAAAFEAARIINRADRISFFAWNCKPWDARRKGKSIPPGWMKPDFEEGQQDVMLDIQRAKFSWLETQSVLLSTMGSQLVYGNTVHDNCWGICYCREVQASKRKYGVGRHCNGTGDNSLGKILMQVRQDLVDGQNFVNSESQFNLVHKSIANGNFPEGTPELGGLSSR